jgi:hypothetical protein
MMSKGINWISEEDACQKLGINKYTLRTYTRNEKRKKLDLRTAKLSKTKILYSGVDIENYINERSGMIYIAGKEMTSPKKSA